MHGTFYRRHVIRRVRPRSAVTSRFCRITRFGNTPLGGITPYPFFDLRRVVRSQSAVCRQPVKLDYLRVADKPGLETLTTLGTKTRSGQGYVMRLCRTRPKEVSECTWERFLLMMSSTRNPSTVNASAMRERWQRQGTASAHINALRF